jgi:hypothetical protein
MSLRDNSISCEPCLMKRRSLVQILHSFPLCRHVKKKKSIIDMVIGLRREALVEALRKPLAAAPSKSVNVKYFGEAKVLLFKYWG